MSYESDHPIMDYFYPDPSKYKILNDRQIIEQLINNFNPVGIETKPLLGLLGFAKQNSSNPVIGLLKTEIPKFHDTKNGFALNHPTYGYIGLEKKGNDAIVRSVGANEKGKGYGKKLYEYAINEANSRGLNFKSDANVTDEAMNVYKSLEKKGYKFKYNPDVNRVFDLSQPEQKEIWSTESNNPLHAVVELIK